MPQGWFSRNIEGFIFLILFVLPVSFMVSNILAKNNWPYLFCLVLFILVPIILGILNYDTKSVYKIYPIQPKYIQAIIQSALEQKDIPFEVAKDFSFHVKTGGEDIVISFFPRNTTMSQVFISPNTEENRPLIKSLCTKIDEAFTSYSLKK